MEGGGLGRLSRLDPGEGCPISGLIKSQCFSESASLEYFSPS